MQWPFLACLTLESLIVMIATMVFGILSWINFDRGLKHWCKSFTFSPWFDARLNSPVTVYVEEVLQLSDFQHGVFRHDIENPSHREKPDKSFANHPKRLEQKSTTELDTPQSPMTFYLPILHTSGKGDAKLAKFNANSQKPIGMTHPKETDERKVRTLLRLSTSFGL
jgi:hypothetical protein